MALQQSAFNVAAQNAPLNTYNFRSPGTPYASLYPTGVIESLLLAPDIKPEATPSFPTMFTDLSYFMSRKKRPVNSVFYQRFEEPWIHVPIVVRTNVGETAASGSTTVTQTLPITDGSNNYVSIGDKIVYPDGTNALVTAKGGTAGAYTLTVSSSQGDGIPAATTGQELQNHGQLFADGFSQLYAQASPEYILYHNALEMSVSQLVRFDKYQKAEWQKHGRIDMVQNALKRAYTSMLTRWQARLIMSTYNKFTLPDGTSVGMTTSGLLEQQSAAGVQIQTVSANQAIDAIREVVFDTALNVGGRKVVLGTRRMLNLIGQTQKADKVRYTPENKSWNMDIYEYDFYGHQLVLVPMDQWTDRALYGAHLQNDLLILNEEDITINYFEGFPMISRKHVLQNMDDNPSNLWNLEACWWEGNFGLELERAWATGRLRIV